MEKEQLKNLKEILLNKLWDLGIPEDSIIIKETKKDNGNVGFYRSFSALSGRPIIYLNEDAHIKVLRQEYGDIDFSTERNRKWLDDELMMTLAHEYGHVIEECLRADSAKRHESWSEINEGYNRCFMDHEDFAEEFAYFLNGKSVNLFKLEAIEKVVDFYKKVVFTADALEFYGKPKWEREFMIICDTYQKSLEKLDSAAGSFDKCKKIAGFLFEKFSQDVPVSIYKFEQIKSDLSNAHEKWKKMDANCAVHYAIVVDDGVEKKVIDLTFKQFDESSEFPLVMNLDDYEKRWGLSEKTKDKIMDLGATNRFVL